MEKNIELIEYLLTCKKFSSKKKSFNLSFIEIKWETIANKCSFEVGILIGSLTQHHCQKKGSKSNFNKTL